MPERERPELPACAAIRHKTGAILAGRRHAECFSAATTFGLDKRDLAQGFMTTKGRFIDRKQAFLMMAKEGIPSASPDGYRGHQLFSEDLY